MSFCCALKNVLKFFTVSRASKIRIYKTIPRPVVTYGSEMFDSDKRGSTGEQDGIEKLKEKMQTSYEEWSVENKKKKMSCCSI